MTDPIVRPANDLGVAVHALKRRCPTCATRPATCGWHQADATTVMAALTGEGWRPPAQHRPAGRYTVWGVAAHSPGYTVADLPDRTAYECPDEAAARELAAAWQAPLISKRVAESPHGRRHDPWQLVDQGERQ